MSEFVVFSHTYFHCILSLGGWEKKGEGAGFGGMHYRITSLLF